VSLERRSRCRFAAGPRWRRSTASPSNTSRRLRNRWTRSSALSSKASRLRVWPDGAHLHRAGLGALPRLRCRPVAGIPHQARQRPLISTNLGAGRRREKTTPSVSIESAQDDSNARLLLRTEPCCPLHYEPVLPGGLEPPLPASGAGVLSPGPWERAWRTQVPTLVCRSDGSTDR
jgi:hypothetical protein